MRGGKKRKADRVYDDSEGEANLPVRKTKEIASTHLDSERKQYNTKVVKLVEDLESKEDGKETFDFVLGLMASPDNQ